jgi:hypothetical protein
MFVQNFGRLAPRDVFCCLKIESTIVVPANQRVRLLPARWQAPGPITTGVSGCVEVVDLSAEALAKAEQRLSQQTTRRMGPCVRRDDD